MGPLFSRVKSKKRPEMKKCGESKGREKGRDRQDGWTDGGRWKKLKRTRESDQGWNNVEREEMGDGKDGDK